MQLPAQATGKVVPAGGAVALAGNAAALSVQGVSAFTRSGVMSMTAASVVVSVPGGLTAASHVLAQPSLVEPLGIRWFEEPCHWYDDAAQMARVRARTRIPINAGQSEITSHGVRRLINANAVDIVNYDASEGGGVTDWRRAAALCATAGVTMAHHEESQIAQHLISAIPHGTCIE